MNSKITIPLLLAFLSAIAVHAQKPEYPKPNGKDQIPFGQKLPPPSLSEQRKLTHSAGLYPFIDTLAKQSGLSAPGGMINKHLQLQNISGNLNTLQRPGNGSNSENFHLTKDINARSESDPENYTSDNYPSEFAVLNNVSYFFADDGIHNMELWRSDATPGGTYLVKDINPGEASSENRGGNITLANGKLYFPAITAVNGEEPWVSDGTASGTHQLIDINNGSSGSNPSQFVAVNNTVFFVANENQLWKTDGTTAGTALVKDVYTSDYASKIFQSTAANGLLFFTADSYSAGRQLWRSDGTAAGTYIVKQIGYYLYDYVAPLQLTEYNNKLFFSVDDGTGRKLWTSDGSFAGTGYAAGNNNVFMQPEYLNINTRYPFKIVNNILYLAGFTYTDGSGLYKFNASNNDGVVLVKDLTTGTDIDFITPVDFAVVNNRLYFKVISATGGYHDELWKSDGDAANTNLIKTFVPGEITFDHNNGNGLLYFNKVDPILYGNELWKSDGTPQGTILVKDIWPGKVSSAPYYLTECNGKLLFNGADDIKGASLYMTDGTAAGTRLVKDINTITTTGSDAGGYVSTDMVKLKSGVVFSAFERGHGYELYKSNGKINGTELVKDLINGESSSYPNFFLSKTNVAYFRANNTNQDLGFPGSTIYKTDGTTGGTKKILDIINAYFISYNVTDNGLVYYVIFNLNTYTYELWRSDGTAAGTYFLNNNLLYMYVVTAGNTAFFIAGDFINGYELWKSDGTAAGTKMVKDINPGYNGSYPFSLFAFKKDVYFGAYDGTGFSNSFWKSDGTDKGTIKLKDITPASGYDAYSINRLFCVSGNYLYLNAYDNANPAIGGELYKTNGTIAGTNLVKNINPTNYNWSYPLDLTEVDGTLFFTADDGVNGRELWVSNGTDASTKLVKDITPGFDFSNLDNLCSAGDKLYFIKDKATPDASLWSSEGNAANTLPVDDAGLNALSSFRNLTGVEDKLFVGAFSYKYGTELYEGGEGDEDKVTAATRSRTSTDVPLVELNTKSFDAIIYPNPTHNSTVLQLKGNTKEVTVTITDMAGRLIWQSSYYNRTQINLATEKLTAGVFVIKVKNGLENKTLKLVKK